MKKLTRSLFQPRREELHNKFHSTEAAKMPPLGNKGLKMLLVLVCPKFVAEKGLNNESKCGKLLESMFVSVLDEKLFSLAWLLYEITAEVQELRKNRVCLYRDFLVCVPLAGSVEPAVCEHDHHPARHDQLLPDQLRDSMDAHRIRIWMYFHLSDCTERCRDNSRHMQ